MIPKKIIDNSDIKLSTFLNSVLEEIPNTQFDIATAFFNIQAYALIKDSIQGVKGFRLLLGRAPEIRSEATLGDVLLKMIREEVEGFDLSKEKDSYYHRFCVLIRGLGRGILLICKGQIWRNGGFLKWRVYYHRFWGRYRVTL